MMGLGWAISFDNRIPRRRPNNDHHNEKRQTSTSDFDSVIPRPCQNSCTQAYSAALTIGRQDLLCSSSNFKPLYAACKQCCTINTPNLSDLRRINLALDDRFGEFTDYCEIKEMGGAFSPPPPDVVTTRTRALVTGTAIVDAWVTVTVGTMNVAVKETGTVEGVGGGDGDGDGGGPERVNTGVIVGAVVGAAIVVILVLGAAVVVLRGRYKKRVKALEGGGEEKRRGSNSSSSGESSTTIGNDVSVTKDKKEEGVGVVVAELDGTPVVKRAEMDVEGSHGELDAEERCKDLDVECGYGELDVSEKRLSEVEGKGRINEDNIADVGDKDGDEKGDDKKMEDKVEKRDLVEKEEQISKENRNVGEEDEEKAGHPKEEKGGIGVER